MLQPIEAHALVRAASMVSISLRDDAIKLKTFGVSTVRTLPAKCFDQPHSGPFCPTLNLFAHVVTSSRGWGRDKGAKSMPDETKNRSHARAWDGTVPTR